VAELTFDSRWQTPLTATNGLPRWIHGVDQQDGHFATTTNCWYAEAAQPVAVGRLSIRLDRQLLNEDVALAILYDHNDAADFVVQLFDDQNQVIVLDLFGNIMAVGNEAKTDTFIVPLRQFPTATRITIRRVKGDIRVYGAVLYPVVGPEVAPMNTLCRNWRNSWAINSAQKTHWSGASTGLPQPQGSSRTGSTQPARPNPRQPL